MYDFFLKCFHIPALAMVGVILSIFIIAYLAYLGIIFFFRAILPKESWGKAVVERVKWPFLFVLFEVAALVSIFILDLQDNFELKMVHGVMVCMIATIGWFLAAVLRSLFWHYEQKLEEASITNLSLRTLLTQGLFLYRLLMLVIVVVTISTILVTFPYIRGVGVGILGSAGIIGLALGFAAKPILTNLIAGFQIAFTETLKIGDAVFLEGDFARIEKLNLTNVVARTWDSRRLILPISYFVDKPYQNWDNTNSELTSYFYLYFDFRMPIDPLRKKVEELLNSTPFWNKKSWGVNVTNMKVHELEVRVDMSANNSSEAFQLRCYMLEKLMGFLQTEYPDMLPCVREREYPA